MFGEINVIRKLATEYSKPQLARMVQMGEIEPQKAVLAGMMIDRIAKSAMQPPQTTVAEDVLGAAPTAAQGQIPQGVMGAPQAPPASAGVSSLPSGIRDMAGGGIVAFADGGDVPSFAGDRGSFIDPEFRTKDPKKIREAQFNILAQELRDQQEAARTSEGDDKQRALSNIQAIQREMRNIRPSTDVNAGIGALIPSAQAAEKPRAPSATKAAAPTKAEAPTGDYYQDPLGAPDYTTEGWSPKQQVERGKTYEPSLQGLMFGYETIDPRKTLPPIAAPEKGKVPNPLNVPRDEQGAPPAAQAPEKPPMGPPTPSMMDRVMGNLRGATIEEPKEKSLKDVMGEQAEADKAYGVDTQKMFDEIRQDYKQSGGDLKQRADKAAGMALMMFGAGLIGARKGEEFETASKVGQQSLLSYMGAMEKINDNEDRLKQRMHDLSMAENQYKRTRSDKALAEVQSNRREIQAVKLENAKLENQALIKGAEFTMEKIKLDHPAMYQTLANIAAEQQAKGNKGYTTLDALRDYQGVGKTGEISRDKAYMEWAKDPILRSQFPKFEDYYAGFQNSGGGGGSGTLNYVPGKGLVPNK